MSDGFQGIQDLITQALKSRDKSQLTEASLLTATLQKVVGDLKTNFDYENALKHGGVSASYQEMFAGVAENFSALGKELLKMRSTYLPYEMLEDVTDQFNMPGKNKSKKISEIIDEDVTLESYENTFFRLLGMPTDSDIRDKALVTVNRKGERLGPEKDVNFQLTNKILEARATAISDRMDSPSSTAYDFLEGNKSSMKRLQDVGFKKTEELEKILKLIKELNETEERDHNSAMKGAALYEALEAVRTVPQHLAAYQIQEASQLPIQFGPIDDGSLMTGNESEEELQRIADANGASPKAAAYVLTRMLDIALSWLEPNLGPVITLSMKKHLWNEHVQKIKGMSMLNLNEPNNFWQYSHLLFPPVQDGRIAKCINEPSKMVAEPFLPESLRTINGHKLKSTLLEAVIRIRLDAVSGFPTKVAQVPASGVGPAEEGNSRAITPDEMGLLESMIILRLFEALHGFAKDVREKIKVVHKAQMKSGRAPSAPAQADEGGNRSDQAQDSTAQVMRSYRQRQLDSFIVVEESLMLLFGDGSIPEALSVQEGVARNAGVKSAHLMSAAISVLDVPRRWAAKSLSELEEVSERSSNKVGSAGTQAPRSVMGVARGVGAIDLLAYLLAMFTAREEVLLSLLTDQQFGYLKEEYPDNFFSEFERDTIDTGAAVCEIADRAFDAYQLFRFGLSEGESNFTFPTLLDYWNN